MKTLLRFLTLVIAFGVILLGSTEVNSWFSDAANSPVSGAASGTLELRVSGGLLAAPALERGADYVEMGSFCVNNDGTLGFKYRGVFESDQPAPYEILRTLTLRVEAQSGEGWITLHEISGMPPDPAQALDKYFKFADQPADLENLSIVQGTSLPGESSCYRMSVKMDAAAPDEFRNISMDFFLKLYATQLANPGWDE